jgi:hypothetical protein
MAGKKNGRTDSKQVSSSTNRSQNSIPLCSVISSITRFSNSLSRLRSRACRPAPPATPQACTASQVSAHGMGSSVRVWN